MFAGVLFCSGPPWPSGLVVLASNMHAVTSVCVYLSEVTMLKTCYNMILTVERDVNSNFDLCTFLHNFTSDVCILLNIFSVNE